jgi:hypothetical protein
MTDPNLDSILTSVKKLLGIPEADTNFDLDIIIHINTALMVLKQIGVGPTTEFVVEDDTSLWSEFLTDLTNLQGVKTYVYFKVRMAFDPPSTGILVDALSKQIEELGYRLNMITEPRIPVIVEEEV